MHSETEMLCSIIKTARQRSEVTMGALAEKVGITERYLYRIENEGKYPSYEVLYKIVRELAINPDLIFYPEKPSKDSEVENLLRMLSACDERSLEVVKATVKALINTAPQKQLQNCFPFSEVQQHCKSEAEIQKYISLCQQADQLKNN